MSTGRESLFSLAGMERLARDQMAAADATHRVTFAAIPPDALKATARAKLGAKNTCQACCEALRLGLLA